MGSKTEISWTDSTWSPLRARVKEDAAEIAKTKGYTSLIQIAEKMAGHVGPHCEHASDGCKRCYSETNNGRCLPANGTGLPFDRRSRDLVDIHLDRGILKWPLKWHKSRNIFVNSQTDTFGEFVPDDLIDEMFAIALICAVLEGRDHIFQFLTKRADRMLRYLTERTPVQLLKAWAKAGNRLVTLDNEDVLFSEAVEGAVCHDWDSKGTNSSNSPHAPWGYIDNLWPLPNVRLGFSAEDQPNFDERWESVQHLALQGWTTWCSAEPLLGPIDASAALCDGNPEADGSLKLAMDAGDTLEACRLMRHGSSLLRWAVIGGESGPGARPMRIEWAEGLIAQCREARTACFMKQLGAYPIWADAQCSPIEPSRGKNGDPAQWPESLRVREMPSTRL